MTEEERLSFEEDLRGQLEEEHQRRASRADGGQERIPPRSEEYERALMAKKVREAFYEEKGYVRYTNSRGELEWLLPEERDRRIKGRKRRKRRRKSQIQSAKEPREPLTPFAWAVLASGFLVLGLFLGYFVLRG